MYYRN